MLDGQMVTMETYNELVAKHVSVQEALDRADRLNGAKDRTISMLRREQKREAPAEDEDKEVLTFWQETLSPRATAPLSEIRLKKVRARRNEKYTVEALKRCIEGYAAYPYDVGYGRRATTGRPDQRKVEVEYIFRDAEKVDAGLRLADRAQEQSDAFTTPDVPDVGPIGAQALRHAAEKGWLIFPCQPNDKVPFPRSNGLLDAKTDTAAIRAYWSRRPDANLAIRTGKESGIVVLDVDGDEGNESLRALCAKYDDLPTTLSVVTPSGGSHYYFQHPGHEVRNTAGFPGPGLDIRGDGGYVLSPPSVVDGKAYQVDERAPWAPMPEWLRTILAQHYARVQSALSEGRWQEFFSGVGQGQRNAQMLRVIGALIAKGHSYDDTLGLALALNEKYCHPPMAPREVQQIMKSKMRMDARRAA